MAIFVNHNKKIFVLTSYKVGYSTLLSQEQSGFKYLHYVISYPIFRHLIKHIEYKRYLIIRNPYDRFLSLFSDKFRKQPKRILENLHTWENVHRCLFPYLNISSQDADERIAAKFFEMTISDFVKLLPVVLSKDEHFMTQTSTKQFKLFNRLPFNLRVNKYFRLEDDLDKLNQLTGINFGVKKNTSDSNRLRNSLTEEDILILNKVYHKDFSLGNYSKLY